MIILRGAGLAAMIFYPAESSQGYHHAHGRAAEFHAGDAGRTPELEPLEQAGYEVNQELLR